MDKLFEYSFENSNFRFKYAKGEPEIKTQEFHNFNEFVLFLDGKSVLISRNIKQELAPWNLVLIPKEQFHQFSVSEPENYVRCILSFQDSPETHEAITEVMNKIKVISSPDEFIVSLFNQMMEVAKSSLSYNEKCMFINSSLVQLLLYLKLNPVKDTDNSTKLSPVVSNALSIIDKKYTESLSVEEISNLLFVSPSTLAHKFTKELNISVYRYITKKRLSFAHQLISQGESLSTAALKSGFSDYSCFYRLYKKYYIK